MQNRTETRSERPVDLTSPPVADITVRKPQKRLYLNVPFKFWIAIFIAIAWTTLSVWLSQRWLKDLADLTNWAFALIAIGFIAYVPGFMNAFLVGTLAVDRRPPRQKLASYPCVTILVAAYNEAEAIADTLLSLARQDYPGLLEVLVLNDGSTDETVAIANATIASMAKPERFTFRVVNYEVNTGKAAVLNRGLAISTHDLITTIDGDSLLRVDGMSQIVERLYTDPADTVAVAGAVMVRNSRENWLTRGQEWDYFHGIAAVKRMQSMYHGTLVAQGAFSLYKKDALIEVGGWPHSVGEDIVVSWALLREGYRVGYAEDALAFTNVPTKFKLFAGQRKRWSRGLIEAFKAHWPLLFKPRMTTLFIWWNLLFLPLDLVYTPSSSSLA